MFRTRLNNLIIRTKVHKTVTAREPHKVDPHRKQVCYSRPGKIGSALLLWLIGVPIPLILLFFLIKGCVT
ncbi:MAG TPA: hypothetical protein VEB22_07720 [Phycisphaerales bacterium]|nr:hypothetical protein [Phycisphaerales bacterium]